MTTATAIRPAATAAPASVRIACMLCGTPSVMRPYSYVCSTCMNAFEREPVVVGRECVRVQSGAHGPDTYGQDGTCPSCEF